MSLSTDELVALARRLELPPLPALGPDPLDDLDPPTRERVLDAALRSLVARNIVDDEERVLPVIASLLEIVARPRVLARVGRRSNNTSTSTYFAAGPDVTVEIVPRTLGVHQLRPFPTVDLLECVLESAGLVERGFGPLEVQFHVSAADLVGVYDALARGHRDDASTILTRGGVDGPMVDTLLGEAPRAWAMSTIAIVHRPTTQRVEGGEITVIDTHDRGLLKVTRVDGARVLVESTALEPFARELLDLLPLG